MQVAFALALAEVAVAVSVLARRRHEDHASRWCLFWPSCRLWIPETQQGLRHEGHKYRLKNPLPANAAECEACLCGWHERGPDIFASIAVQSIMTPHDSLCDPCKCLVSLSDACVPDLSHCLVGSLIQSFVGSIVLQASG